MASDPNPVPAPNATAVPASPGPLLRKRRLENGWSVAEVARALCLSSSQLDALERDDYENLPGETYVLGYWRSYASLLGIDIKDSVAAHKKYLRDTASGRMPNPESRRLRRSGDSSNHHFGVSFALLSVVFLLGVWYWQNPSPDSLTEQGGWSGDGYEPGGTAGSGSGSGSRAESGRRENDEDAYDSLFPELSESIIALPEPNFFEEHDARHGAVGPWFGPHSELNGEVGNDESAADIAASAAAANQPFVPSGIRPAEVLAATARQSTGTLLPAQPGTTPTSEIIFAVDEETWLEVHDHAGKRLINRTVTRGQRLTLAGQPPFSVFIGNARGVAVQYLGEPVSFTAHGGGLFARFTVGAR